MQDTDHHEILYLNCEIHSSCDWCSVPWACQYGHIVKMNLFLFSIFTVVGDKLNAW